MSAGICLLNRSGIVMAADSAVTIGDNKSVYNSADKVYQISDKYPVGALMYQSMNFMNIPIDLILRKFSKHIKREKSKLLDYLEEFKVFLIKEKGLFRFQSNEFRFFASYYHEVANRFRIALKDKAAKKISEVNRQLTDDEHYQNSEESLEEIKSDINQIKNVENFDIRDYFNEKYKGDFETLFKNEFKVLKDEQYENLISILCDLIHKQFGIEYTGLTFAGFGKDEIFPSAIHIKMYGIIDDKLKYVLIGEHQISELKTSDIITLAQQDVMQQFIFGTNDKTFGDVKRIVNETIKSKIKESHEPIILANQPVLLNTFKDLGKEVLELLFNGIHKDFYKPIHDSVSFLPTNELCLLAEEMINMTSLRRKIILDNYSGTVGGPVDIAIINKIDGFRWKNVKNGYLNQKKGD